MAARGHSGLDYERGDIRIMKVLIAGLILLLFAGRPLASLEAEKTKANGREYTQYTGSFPVSLHSPDGAIYDYRFCRLLTGKMPNTVGNTFFVILCNDRNLSFGAAGERFWSSSRPLQPDECRVLWIGAY